MRGDQPGALLFNEEVVRPDLPRDLAEPAFDAPPIGASDDGAERGGAAAGIPTLAEVERQHIRWVLEMCGGNPTLAAQHLGITRQTLAKKFSLDRASTSSPRPPGDDGDPRE